MDMASTEANFPGSWSAIKNIVRETAASRKETVDEFHAKDVGDVLRVIKTLSVGQIQDLSSEYMEIWYRKEILYNALISFQYVMSDYAQNSSTQCCIVDFKMTLGDCVYKVRVYHDYSKFNNMKFTLERIQDAEKVHMQTCINCKKMIL